MIQKADCYISLQCYLLQLHCYSLRYIRCIRKHISTKDPLFAYIHNFYYCNALTFSLKKLFYSSNYPYIFRTKDINPFVVYMRVFKNLVDQKMGYH